MGSNTWKSDLKTISQPNSWKHAFWLCIIMIDRMLAPFFLLIGHITGYIMLIMHFDPKLLFTWIAWILITRFIKLFGYFRKHPATIIHLPFYILFTYWTSVLKIYSLIIINKKPNWMTR